MKKRTKNNRSHSDIDNEIIECGRIIAKSLKEFEHPKDLDGYKTLGIEVLRLVNRKKELEAAHLLAKQYFYPDFEPDRQAIYDISEGAVVDSENDGYAIFEPLKICSHITPEYELIARIRKICTKMQNKPLMVTQNDPEKLMKLLMQLMAWRRMMKQKQNKQNDDAKNVQTSLFDET